MRGLVANATLQARVKELERVLRMIEPCARVADVLENGTQAFCPEFVESVKATGRCDQPWTLRYSKCCDLDTDMDGKCEKHPEGLVTTVGGKHECLNCAAQAALREP